MGGWWFGHPGWYIPAGGRAELHSHLGMVTSEGLPQKVGDRGQDASCVLRQFLPGLHRLDQRRDCLTEA